ncbi:C-type lectin domain family 2 member D-like isoform X1 [Fundulus heteroclitus]|uniref:C-type lectin domain family 2 member D-like isoform X1 n=1 Tax=Fundulus heteroclitus TaxID=8078 RepID=UPI00165BFD03|nr:C-type lectin domain family 2 member D-like isoform X1 [Fundulus heteroclitus]
MKACLGWVSFLTIQQVFNSHKVPFHSKGTFFSCMKLVVCNSDCYIYPISLIKIKLNVVLVEAPTQKRRATVQRNSYKAGTLTLGLLCLLLLVGISVLLVLYLSVNLNAEQPCWPCQQRQNQSNIEWQEFRVSHFYYASAEKKNWTESRKDCQSKGGDLVVINSKDKQEFVKIMKIHGDSWIGLQTREGPDWKMKWQWVDGSELKYTLWEQGVMSLPEAESKAYINQRGSWMHNNTGLKHWICERRKLGTLHDNM